MERHYHHVSPKQNIRIVGRQGVAALSETLTFTGKTRLKIRRLCRGFYKKRRSQRGGTERWLYVRTGAACLRFTVSFCLHGRSEDRVDVIDENDGSRNARTHLSSQGVSGKEKLPFFRFWYELPRFPWFTPEDPGTPMQSLLRPFPDRVEVMAVGV